MRTFLVSLLVLGVLLGATVFNRVTPFVLGMPTFFMWALLNVLFTSVITFVILRIDMAAGKIEE
ncbi:ABC-type multidrug transport system permease subunit [Bradyrhizobium sp. USDA 4518]